MLELVPLHESIESNSVQLSTLLSSCRHPQQLHPSVTSSVDVMKRIVAKSSSVLSRAKQGTAGANDVAVVLELASQCHKIVESVTVQVGKHSCQWFSVGVLPNVKVSRAIAKGATGGQ